MDIAKNGIEIIFSLALFINALLFIPQIVKIYREKSSKGVSQVTFIGFLLIQLATVLHGVINNDQLLVIGYIFSMVTCGTVIILSFVFQHHSGSVNSNIVNINHVLRQAPGHIYWKDKDGMYMGCNDSQAQAVALNSQLQIIGKSDYDLHPLTQAENLRSVDLEVMQQDKTYIIEEISDSIEGKDRLYLSHKKPLKNSHGQIVGIVGVSLDITEAKKTSIERLELLENIIALMPGHVYWVNRQGDYLGCNDIQAQSAGLQSRKDIVGKRNKDLPWNYNSGVLPETLDNINQGVMCTGKAVMVEEPALLKDGTEAIFLSNKAPLSNGQGEIIGMVGISFDITEQKRIEKELQDTKQRLEGMTLVSASIAHELRTPLSSLNIGVSTLQEVLPQFIDSYKLAKEANLAIPKIKPSYIDLLAHKLVAMEKEIRASLTFIDMLLINLNPTQDASRIKIFSIADCIDEAIARYPLSSEQKPLVRWQRAGDDFNVNGDALLMIHVLFNLLKNALYFVAKAAKGEIEIWVESASPLNKLYFKDTGTGIPAEQVSQVFDSFFSRSHHGAGIGLTFCKKVMENLGGQIICESVEGVYTLFILSFPKVV